MPGGAAWPELFTVVPGAAVGAAFGFAGEVAVDALPPGAVVVLGAGVEPPVPLGLSQPKRPTVNAALSDRTKSPVVFRIFMRISWIEKEKVVYC